MITKDKILKGILSGLIFLFFFNNFYSFSFEDYDKKISIYNIKSETETYKNFYFKDTHEYNELSVYIDDYMKYTDCTIAVLMNKLTNNSKLYNKLTVLPPKKNRELSLIITNNKEVDSYITFLKENGLRLKLVQGDLQIYFDPLYFINNFKEVLPNIFVDYFRIDYEDLNEGYEEDAGLIVEWDLIRKKINRLEFFLNNYKNDINCIYPKQMAVKKISRYLKDYLIGLPNSPIYKDDDKMIIDEIKISYETFLKENSNSRYYSIIKYYYNRLKENNFKVDEGLFSDPELIQSFHKAGLMFFKYQ